MSNKTAIAKKNAEKTRARAKALKAENACKVQQSQADAAQRNAVEKAKRQKQSAKTAAKKQGKSVFPEIKVPARQEDVIDLTPDMMLGKMETKRHASSKSILKNKTVMGIAFGFGAGFASRTLVKLIVMQFGVAAALTTIPVVATASALIPFVIGGMLFGAVGGAASLFVREFVKSAIDHREKAEQELTWRKALGLAWRDRAKRRTVVGKDGKVTEKRGWLSSSLIHGSLSGALGGAFGGLVAETLSHWGSLSGFVGEHVSAKLGTSMASWGDRLHGSWNGVKAWATATFTRPTEAFAASVTTVGKTITASIRQTTSHLNVLMQNEFDSFANAPRPNIRQTILSAISGIPPIDHLMRFLPKGLYVPNLNLHETISPACAPSAPVVPCGAPVHGAPLDLKIPQAPLGVHTAREAMDKDFLSLATGAKHPDLHQIASDTFINADKPTSIYPLPKDLADTNLVLSKPSVSDVTVILTQTPMPDVFSGLMSPKVFALIPQDLRERLVTECAGKLTPHKAMLGMTDAAYFLLNKTVSSPDQLAKVRQAAFFLYREAATLAQETGETDSSLGHLANSGLSYCLRNGMGTARNISKAIFHAVLSEGRPAADQTIAFAARTRPDKLASVRAAIKELRAVYAM